MPIGRIENRQSDKLRLSFGVGPFGRVHQHRKALPILFHEIKRHFVEEALHPQHRREVCLVENPACYIEELVKSLID